MPWSANAGLRHAPVNSPALSSTFHPAAAMFTRRAVVRAAALSSALMLGACSSSAVKQGREADDHTAHAADAASSGIRGAQPGDARLPAGSNTVAARLAGSPRHGEYVMIARAPGGNDSLRAWIVYPERRDKAPVVVVLHEIFGVSTWIRGVTDQLAADGYIAIAPDLLSGLYTLAPGDTILQTQATALIRTVTPGDVQRDIARTAEYAMALPAAQQKFGVVGFCWGGSTSFATAARAHPKLRGSVVYYGSSPALTALTSITTPVLGLYGGNDARVNATIAAADSAMKALKKSYEPLILAGAGHGFLRQQDGQAGANMTATQTAWPKTLAFFRKTLGR